MKWHRRRCPTGNIKVAVVEDEEARGSLTPMADLLKARLLVIALRALPADIGCALVHEHEHSSDIPSQEEEEAEPSCPARHPQRAAPWLFCSLGPVAWI
jgi:hypothetical protein